MRLICRKHLGALHPVDDTGREVLRRLPSGEYVTVEFKRSRNIKHHRLYWGLVSLVWDNIDQERYPSPEDLHGAIKISVGLRTRIVMPDGTVAFMPGSIAWGKMDQDQFSVFYDRVCDAVAKWFLPGVTSAELRREVEEMIGASIRQSSVAPRSAEEAGAGAGGPAQWSAGGPPSPPPPAPAASEPPWDGKGLTKKEWEKLP